MNRCKQLTAGILSLLLLLTLLSSCAGGGRDPIEEAFGYSKDTVFAKFNGQEITAEMYLPWLANYVTYIDSMYKSMGNLGVDWDEDMGEGVLAKDFMKSTVMDTVKLFMVIELYAKQYKLELGKEDKEAYQEQRASAVEALGSEEAYLASLYSACLTDASMEKIHGLEILRDRLQETICGEGKEIVATKDQVHQYVSDLGIFQAKHILLLNQDIATGEPYPPEQITAQKEKAYLLLSELRSAADPLTLFDKLMQEHSQDTGLESNPDGYLFSTNPDGVDFTGRMVEEFEKGTAALRYNEISDVITSPYGYHIILRVDPLTNEETYMKYLDKYYTSKMDNMYQEAMKSADISFSEDYQNLDAEAFFTALQAYGERLNQELLSAMVTPEAEEEGLAGNGVESVTPEAEAKEDTGEAVVTPEGAITPEAGDGTGGAISAEPAPAPAP